MIDFDFSNYGVYLCALLALSLLLQSIFEERGQFSRTLPISLIVCLLLYGGIQVSEVDSIEPLLSRGLSLLFACLAYLSVEVFGRRNFSAKLQKYRMYAVSIVTGVLLLAAIGSSLSGMADISIGLSTSAYLLQVLTAALLISALRATDLPGRALQYRILLVGLALWAFADGMAWVASPEISSVIGMTLFCLAMRTAELLETKNVSLLPKYLLVHSGLIFLVLALLYPLLFWLNQSLVREAGSTMYRSIWWSGALGSLYFMYLHPAIKNHVLLGGKSLEKMIVELSPVTQDLNEPEFPSVLLENICRILSVSSALLFIRDKQGTFQKYGFGYAGNRITEKNLKFFTNRHILRTLNSEQPLLSDSTYFIDQLLGLTENNQEQVETVIGLPSKHKRIKDKFLYDLHLMHDIRLEVFQILNFQGEFNAYLFLGEKSSKLPFFKNELNVLDGFKSHIATLVKSYRDIRALRNKEKNTRVEIEELADTIQDLKVMTHLVQERTLVYKSPSMGKIMETIEDIAGWDQPVLNSGETGTGKEIISRLIHEKSHAEEPFLIINCAAVPEHLFESEIFGHIRGAYTDANQDRVGLVEQAGKGTLCFDEMGELSANMQSKILRLLQERKFTPIGDSKEKQAHCRFIFSTNRDLEAEIKKGNFREDLFYRISTFHIQIPPLRQRKEDIPALIEHFLRTLSIEFNNDEIKITDEAVNALMNYNWPGNIRELNSTLIRCMAGNSSGSIQKKDLPGDIQAERSKPIMNTISPAAPSSGIESSETLDEVISQISRKMIEKALEQEDGNKSRAARALGLTRGKFLYKLKEFAISP